jgi:hypothetical protein
MVTIVDYSGGAIMYAINVKGVDGDWQLVVPDYVTLRQGGAAQPIHFDGLGDPIVMDVHYTPDVLLSDEYHGMVTIQANDLPGAVDDAAPLNGLRGVVQVNFFNHLSTAMNPSGANTTLVEYVGSTTDRFANDPSGHPHYAHFHLVEAADYPGLTATILTMKDFQPAAGTPGAPNYVDIAGTIPAGAKMPFGNITLHERDTNAEVENFYMNFFVTGNAVDANAVTQAQQQFAAMPALPDYSTIDATPAADSRYYFIFRADQGGDFYTGFVTENTGKYTTGSIVGTAKGVYQIIYEQPFGYDISTGLSPSGQAWGNGYQDGRVNLLSYHDGSGADYNSTYFANLHTGNVETASGYRGLSSEVDYVDVGGQWVMFGRGGEYLV